MTKKTTPTLQKSTKEKVERIKKLIALIERFGYYNLDKTALAEQFGVSRMVLYEDIKLIKTRGIDVIDMPLMQIEMHRMMQSIHSMTLRKMHDPAISESDRINYLKVGIEATNTELKFLENFGAVSSSVNNEGFAAFAERVEKEDKEKELDGV